MARGELNVAPVGKRVGVNITTARQTAAFSLQDLSDEMGILGRPISDDGLRRIESGHRRVDVDDLLAIAVCLNVNVLTLLAPTTHEQKQPAMTAVGNRDMGRLNYQQLLEGQLGPTDAQKHLARLQAIARRAKIFAESHWHVHKLGLDALPGLSLTPQQREGLVNGSAQGAAEADNEARREEVEQVRTPANPATRAADH